MRRLAIWLGIFTVGCWLAIGCVAFSKGTKGRGDEGTKAPTADTAVAPEQQGFVNSAVGAMTGFVHSSSMSLTLGVLLAWIMYLAHRREATQDKALARMNHELLELMRRLTEAKHG